MPIPVSFHHGIVIRQAALAAHGLNRGDLLRAFETDKPFGESDGLISFGPCFGPDACSEFISRLQGLGLIYVDDFFDLALDHPEWLQFKAVQS